MMVTECLGSCYNQLPQPEMVLSPEDSELNYYLWMPGVQYQPRIQKKLSKLRSITVESDVVSVNEVVEEVVSLCSVFVRRACSSLRTRLCNPGKRALAIDTHWEDREETRCC
ncbi:myosin light chain 1 [Babesia caballi]|uniref:Myosin light chain 1 n=1 Tax=Babesia caballi TaxID=5871 RepID=A0AAV4LS18_BABCB|nr:myosin light chain 1 [Babesia caballi]